jgi:hypothetical protein
LIRLVAWSVIRFVNREQNLDASRQAAVFDDVPFVDELLAVEVMKFKLDDFGGK